MKDKVNLKVKHRQWFRPFAPSVLRQYVSDWFEDDVDSPYMSFVSTIKQECCEKIPAVVHFDRTARLQTVTEKDNKWYYNLLSKWHDKSGTPILLNTSFNDKEPICETPEHALNCFLGTEIDFLYFVIPCLRAEETASIKRILLIDFPGFKTKILLKKLPRILIESETRKMSIKIAQKFTKKSVARIIKLAAGVQQ